MSLDVLSGKSYRLDIDSAIVSTEIDRRLNIRLVSAGHSWVGVVVLHKKVNLVQLFGFHALLS
jgi:hypothetical protein